MGYLARYCHIIRRGDDIVTWCRPVETNEGVNLIHFSSVLSWFSVVLTVSGVWVMGWGGGALVSDSEGWLALVKHLPQTRGVKCVSH